MSGGTHTPGNAQHLVAMANDIGNYFRVQGREEAIAGIASHIQKYWTPRMRQKLNIHLAQGDSGLDELPLAAVERLNRDHPVGEASLKSAAAP